MTTNLGSTLTDITIISLFKTKYKNIHCGYKYLILGANKKKKEKKIFISFVVTIIGDFVKSIKKINFNKFSNYSFLIICGNIYKKDLN